MIAKRMLLAAVVMFLATAAGSAPLAKALLDPPKPSKPDDKPKSDKPKGDKPDDGGKKDDGKSGKEDAQGQAEVRILMIRATKSNAKCDSELKEIADELKKQFKFDGYKLEQKKTESVKLGSGVTAEYKSCKVVVTPESRGGEKVEFSIRVSREEGKKERVLLDTRVKARAGQLTLYGGPNLDGGDTLVIAVGAK